MAAQIQAAVTALEWKQNVEAAAAPANMRRDCGSATVDGSVVYFRTVNRINAYSSQMDNWTNLPDCPNNDSSLTVVNGLLTAVGGTKKGKYTNAVVSLTGTGSERKWSEHFPPMPTKRCDAAVVCSGTSLVAAGGAGDKGRLTTVEIMGTDVPQWFTADRLPHPFYLASATVCGDNLYLLGGKDENDPTKSVLTCSLTALLESYQAQSLGGRLDTLSLAEDPKVWRKVADVPVYYSTCTTLCGQLLAVGGRNEHRKDSDAVYEYDPTKDTWSTISRMPSDFLLPLVAPLPGNKLVVCRGENVYIASTIQQ